MLLSGLSSTHRTVAACAFWTACGVTDAATTDAAACAVWAMAFASWPSTGFEATAAAIAPAAWACWAPIDASKPAPLIDTVFVRLRRALISARKIQNTARDRDRQ